MTEGPPPDLAGRLLVAPPVLTDPNFARTVVLVLHHDATGSVGLVLNRPSEMEVREPLPAWAALAAEPPVLFFGGPVGAGAVICLATTRPGTSLPEHEGWRPLLGRLGRRLGTLDLHADPDRLGAEVEALRVFAGYAGWGPGQLVGEIDLGGWLVVEARPEDALTSTPAMLWKAVLRRQGGELAVLAAYPSDPTAN